MERRATNWLNRLGSSEHAIEKLSHRLGTSVANLRKAYVHLPVTDDDWDNIGDFGSRRVSNQSKLDDMQDDRKTKAQSPA